MGLETIGLGAAIIGIIVILAIFFTFVPITLWISALAAGVKISIFTLIGMRLR
ncbi:MAG: flotillin-like FloA family protein, partial [Planococcus donghaensis]